MPVLMVLLVECLLLGMLGVSDTVILGTCLIARARWHQESLFWLNLRDLPTNI